MRRALRQYAPALLLALGLLALPCVGAAQVLGTVAGTVKDPSGGVLPGVTVEVSSPALIEKVRSSVTDGSGQYRIINLPPGNVHRHLQPDRVQHRPARRRRGITQLHVERRWRASGRSRPGDDHGHRREPDRGHPVLGADEDDDRYGLQGTALGRFVDPDGRARARRGGVEHGRRRRAGRSDRRHGVCARQPAGGRRVDDRRLAHRQHVHQLEPDEHEPVAAAVRSGGRAVVGADGGDRHQRRDHERHSEGRRQLLQRDAARQRLWSEPAGQQRDRPSAGARSARRVHDAQEALRHQRRGRRADQAGSRVVLRHVAVLHERVLPGRPFLSDRRHRDSAHERSVAAGVCRHLHLRQQRPRDRGDFGEAEDLGLVCLSVQGGPALAAAALQPVSGGVAHHDLAHAAVDDEVDLHGDEPTALRGRSHGW